MSETDNLLQSHIIPTTSTSDEYEDIQSTIDYTFLNRLLPSNYVGSIVDIAYSHGITDVSDLQYLDIENFKNIPVWIVHKLFHSLKEKDKKSSFIKHNWHHILTVIVLVGLVFFETYSHIELQDNISTILDIDKRLNNTEDLAKKLAQELKDGIEKLKMIVQEVNDIENRVRNISKVINDTFTEILEEANEIRNINREAKILLNETILEVNYWISKYNLENILTKTEIGWKDSFYVSDSGNVGIATSFPNSTLDVNGTILQKGNNILSGLEYRICYKDGTPKCRYDGHSTTHSIPCSSDKIAISGGCDCQDPAAPVIASRTEGNTEWVCVCGGEALEVEVLCVDKT